MTATRYLHTTEVLIGCTRMLKRSECGTRKGVLVCRYCGSRLVAREYVFGVFEWRGDGYYWQKDAIATFSDEARAERYAGAYSSSAVVRSLGIATYDE
jgi:hypothetical protein